MGTDLSIIIPTYKRHSSLQHTLQSVAQYRTPSSEVIVIDQSPDSEQQAPHFRSQFPFILYICSKTPGLPRARNTGITNSSGRVILFIDDDMLLHPQCCTEHLALHTHHAIAIVAGRIVQSNTSTTWAATTMVASINLETGETTGNFDLDYTGKVPYATGGHLSISRDVIQTIGPFNPLFIGNALYEDIDFSCRARNRGLTIWYAPQAIVYHGAITTGGCHNSPEKRYLKERLHNHLLFYILHISVVPKKVFIRYLRNLIEYITRTPTHGHSILQGISCITYILRAYYHSFVSRMSNKYYYISLTDFEATKENQTE